MTDNGSIWSLIFTGNWFALALLALLMLLSATSWAIIFAKGIQLRRVRAENNHFYLLFRREKSINEVFNASQKFTQAPLARLFDGSYRELSVFRQSMENTKVASDARDRLMESLSRRLESVYNQQSSILENRLGFLAIVSSASPYLGLFGTVLGIIDAFRNIGMMGVTSLAVVAPGISEALVATAAGLMAAIPALVAYNLYRNQIRELSVQMKNFALEVTNRLERLL